MYRHRVNTVLIHVQRVAMHGWQENDSYNRKTLKGIFYAAFLARVVSWLSFGIAIFMPHKVGDSKGKPGDDTCKACLRKQTF